MLVEVKENLPPDKSFVMQRNHEPIVFQTLIQICSSIAHMAQNPGLIRLDTSIFSIAESVPGARDCCLTHKTFDILVWSCGPTRADKPFPNARLMQTFTKRESLSVYLSNSMDAVYHIRAPKCRWRHGYHDMMMMKNHLESNTVHSVLQCTN